MVPHRRPGPVLRRGFVEITGRLRERILRGGYSVFPQEVEAVLAAHPDVAEAAVVGVPHADLGEEVAAFVVLKPEASTAAEGVADYCQARLARFKYPRHIRFVSELPKGPTGKVLKVELLRCWGSGKRGERSRRASPPCRLDGDYFLTRKDRLSFTC